MITTRTDIKPLEVLLFMRPVKLRLLFEQMLDRGTRVINPTDLIAVTPDAARKTHFVIVDAVGVVDGAKVETQTLEQPPHSWTTESLWAAYAQLERDRVCGWT